MEFIDLLIISVRRICGDINVDEEIYDKCIWSRYKFWRNNRGIIINKGKNFKRLWREYLRCIRREKGNVMEIRSIDGGEINYVL